MASFFNGEHTSTSRSIVKNIKSLHISCGSHCLEVTKSSEDFIGICILHPNGEKLLVDSNGRRVKSGYIFAEASSVLEPPSGSNTMHRQTYNKIFTNMADLPDVVIVGFSQKGRKLKGASYTFNSEHATNLLQSGKECLFSYRMLIFGAIIMHKVNGVRNVSQYSACLCICLYLIMKRQKDADALERFPIEEIDLDNQEVFMKEMFDKMGIHSYITETALGQHGCLVSYVPGGKWFRSKQAIYQIMRGLQADMDERDFNCFMVSLGNMYEPTTSFGILLRQLLKLFGIFI